MDALFGLSTSLLDVKFRYDDDIIDRLNHFFTPTLLVIFCAVVSTYSWVGTPVICWLPNQISDKKGYIDDICWISNTYWLPLDEDIPRVVPEREDLELNYYQWVPFMLLVQALLFYVPCLIWRSMNSATGINVNGVVDSAVNASELDPDSHHKDMKILGQYMDYSLGYRKDQLGHSVVEKIRRSLDHIWGKTTGNYLYTFYILVKFIYLLNAILQLFIINIFLRIDYNFYGVELLADLAAGRSWRNSGRFPRLTMCDFEIRVLGNLHRHTVQCVLPINMFNEKIYIIIWFWLAFVAILTLFSLVKWLLQMWVPAKRRAFVKKFLILSVGRENLPKKTVHRRDDPITKFAVQHLKVDGIFIMQIIAANTSDRLMSDIMKELWGLYQERIKKKDDERHQSDPQQPPSTNDTPSDESFGNDASVIESDEKVPLADF